MPNYTINVINDPLEFQKIVQRILETKSTFAIELMDKDVAIAIRGETYFISPTSTQHVVRILKPALEEETIYKVAINGKELYKTFKASGVEIENILDLGLGQKCLLAGLWVENCMSESYILKTHGDFDVAPGEGLEWKAARINAIFCAAEIMYSRLQEKNLVKVFNIERNAVQAFGDMEFYGQVLDRDQWQRNIDQNILIMAEEKKRLDMFFAPVIADINEDGTPNINYGSSQQVLAVLQKMGVRVNGALIDSTNKNVLKHLMHLPPIQALRRWRSAEERVSNFGTKYIAACDSKGVIRPLFDQYAASTGRPGSYGGINFLNIPKDENYRKAFIAGEGRMISSVDQNAVELRILADLSNDNTMISVLNRGEDIHCFSASKLYDKNIVDKNDPLRITGKAFNLGIAYGKTVEALWDDLLAQGFAITLDETSARYEKYKKTFKGAFNYLDYISNNIGKNYEIVNRNGRRRKWIPPDTHNGYVPSHIKREACNFPMQSVSNDMSKAALAELRKQFKRRKLDAFIYNYVYDETGVSGCESQIHEIHELHKKIIKEESERMLSKVSMEVDGGIGKSWG